MNVFFQSFAKQPYGQKQVKHFPDPKKRSSIGNPTGRRPLDDKRVKNHEDTDGGLLRKKIKVKGVDETLVEKILSEIQDRLKKYIV